MEKVEGNVWFYCYSKKRDKQFYTTPIDDKACVFGYDFNSENHRPKNKSGLLKTGSVEIFTSFSFYVERETQSYILWRKI
ncbi:MAG: hypothetical protein IJX07_07775 [Bacillales bacterium]|nr:hypothetical protein [Bacillales bacterium]